jgi:hypothetical protein
VQYGGIGYHVPRVLMDDPNQLTICLKFLLVYPLIYLPAAALPKLSILALYFRVFGTKLNPITRTICWVTVILTIGNCVANFFVTFAVCRPLNFLWDKSVPGGTCLDINAWWRWASLMNIVTDVIMLVLPLPHVYKLQAPKKVKIGLGITFTTGSMYVQILLSP